MSLSTYSGLQEFVAGLLHRNDLPITDFITLCEAQMNRRLRVRPMVARTTITVDAEFVSLPADFLQERSMALASTPPRDLMFDTVESLDQLSGAQTIACRPQRVAVVGGDFRFFPVPDQSYSAELTYFQKIPALSDSNDTNWLLTDWPDAYIYGTALQSAPYIRDDTRIATWATLYETVLADIQRSLAERKGGRLQADRALLPIHYDFIRGL